MKIKITKNKGAVLHALIKNTKLSETAFSYSAIIASEGQTSTHAPQSEQVSGSIL
jgi:hypothetical protein